MTAPDLDAPLAELVQRFRAGAAYVRGVAVGPAAFAGVETAGAMIDRFLPPEDVGPFHALAAPREEGLRAARGGDLPAAAALLDEARRAVDAAPLSPRGRLLARSLYDSAEAFLHYRAGRHAEALGGIDAAMAATCRLSDEHRYPGAEGRRLHLAHLVLKVELRRGADPREVLRLAFRLWDYVEGNAAAWPFAPCAAPPPPIAPRLAALSLNEIITEAALMLAAEPGMAAWALDLLAREQRARSPVQPYPFVYAHAWRTCAAGLRAAGEPADALHGAARFLGVVDGPRPLLWYAAARDTHRYLAALPGAAAREAADVIARERPPFPGLPAALKIAPD